MPLPPAGATFSRRLRPQEVRPLDQTDRAILAILAADARVSNKLAERVGVAQSTCLARVRALRADGVIRGFHADIDPRALGHHLQAMIAVRLQPTARGEINEFIATLSRRAEVLEVYFVARANDFMVHVATASTDELRWFVGDVLNSDPAIAGTETNLIFQHTRARGHLGVIPRVAGSPRLGEGGAMRVLLTGASGFVGGRLGPALEKSGHEVLAMTRRPQDYRGAGTAVQGDVHDAESLRTALAGCEAAYYLVHSLDQASFAERDADAARTFARAAAETGLGRIVYLGGLGDDRDELSEHLRSRREVERLLAGTGVPVTALRAGIVIGHGGISWELTRQLVEHLPAMITPRWVHTRTQPIAVDDVVHYLVGVLDEPRTAGRAFDVGGPDVLEYLEMLRRVADIQGRRMPVLAVPLLTPRLSARWLALVTTVNRQTGRSLIESMTNEVVVRDDSIRRLVPFEPVDYDSAVLAALAERARAPARRARQVRPTGPRDRIVGALPRWLAERVPRDHQESPGAVRRRRRLVATTALAGAGLLGAGLSTRPDSPQFYGLTLATAGTWVAGGLASGRLHLGYAADRDATLHRPVVTPVLVGAGAFALFYGAALVARRIPVLGRAISAVLGYADRGTDTLVLVTTLANGAAEEVFFRGALYAAVGRRHPVATSTAVYALATSATRNPALVLASVVMGTLFGLQRRASGGIQAPLLTHLTWSTLMLRYLPPLFRDRAPDQTAAGAPTNAASASSSRSTSASST